MFKSVLCLLWIIMAIGNYSSLIFISDCIVKLINTISAIINKIVRKYHKRELKGTKGIQTQKLKTSWQYKGKKKQPENNQQYIKHNRKTKNLNKNWWQSQMLPLEGWAEPAPHLMLITPDKSLVQERHTIP